MRANMWSRVLVVLSFFSLSVQASPPDAQEPGTRVIVRLAEASGELPDAEKMVESLVSVGGKHQIQVKRHVKAGQQEHEDPRNPRMRIRVRKQHPGPAAPPE
ncbi:hypothetical protein [Hyalangium gracile]|uniref:hypothetical protein n=1 Tax=Hyalangium gracile TaxID=394092 RepID=UPI001CCB744E|nr:hypothetical protein [Hyalangium gracile]